MQTVHLSYLHTGLQVECISCRGSYQKSLDPTDNKSPSPPEAPSDTELPTPVGSRSRSSSRRRQTLSLGLGPLALIPNPHRPSPEAQGWWWWGLAHGPLPNPPDLASHLFCSRTPVFVECANESFYLTIPKNSYTFHKETLGEKLSPRITKNKFFQVSGNIFRIHSTAQVALGSGTWLNTPTALASESQDTTANWGHRGGSGYGGRRKGLPWEVSRVRGPCPAHPVTAFPARGTI